MTQTTNTRAIVLDMLMEILERGNFSHVVLSQVLEKYDYISDQERHFIVRLTKGTVEKVPELDHLLNQVSKTKVKKMKPLIREILRMSIYQLRYMDNVPESAVVNEAVKLAKKRGMVQLKGFVNGVLRGYIRVMASDHPLRLTTDCARYCMPQWIIDRWRADYGEEDTALILEGAAEKPALIIRTNTLQSTPQELAEHLTSRGVTLQSIPDLLPERNVNQAVDSITRGDISSREGGKLLYGNGSGLDARELGVFEMQYSGSLTDLEELNRGDFYIQDLSSMLPAAFSEAKPGMVVYDLCAAPGGKSIDCAMMMQDQGQIISRDLSFDKADRIDENVERLGIESIETEVFDGRQHDTESEGMADVIIADLPCSGLGVLRRKPDIKYRLKESDIQDLQLLQRQILEASVSYLKAGGRLVYSTCTINRMENQDNAKWIQETYPDLTLVREEQIYPDTQHDGFYVAVFDKKA